MDTIIYRKMQDCWYFCIRHGKSNLASNDVEDIDLPIVFVSIVSTV